MKHHLTVLAAFTAFGLSTHAWAADNAWAISPAWSQSSDSDGLSVHKAFATAMPSYTNGLKWQGVEWQEQRYTQNSTALNGHGVNYTAQDLDALTGLGYSLKVGINQGPEKPLSLVTGTTTKPSIRK